jgi:hypothetical protein
VAAIDGSLPGRFASFTGHSDAGTASQIWRGIREANFGTSDFVGRWECELGDLAAGAAIASDSDNASPLASTDNVISYVSTTDSTKILSLGIEHVRVSSTDDTMHYIGDYLVLLRCRLSSALSTRLQLTTGFRGNATNEQACPYVYISSTDYFFYEMGTINIPGGARYETGLTDIEDFRLRLYVMALGIAPTITCDFFVLIPSRHMVKLSDSIPGASSFYGFMSEDGSAFEYAYSTTDRRSIQASYLDFTYPVGGGLSVMAAQDTTGSNLAAAHVDMGFALTYYERFRTHGE